MNTTQYRLLAGGAAAALVIGLSTGAMAQTRLNGDYAGPVTTTTNVGASTTRTEGDSTVAPYENSTITSTDQTVDTTMSLVNDPVTAPAFGGQAVTGQVSASGTGTQAQTSETVLHQVFNPGPPPSVASATTTGPTVANVGAPSISAVAASGSVGTAVTGMYSSTLSTSGAVTNGVVAATETVGAVSTSGVNYATYAGTATYNPTTGTVTVNTGTTPVSQTTVTAAGLTTTGAVNAGTVSARTLTANVGGTAGAAAIDAGNGRITNVAAGTAATDAVNFGQLDAVRNELQGQMSTLDASVNARLDAMYDEANAGTAIAVAMGGAAFLPGKQFNLTGNIGHYRGETAVAAQVGILVNESLALNGGVATGLDNGGTAGRAGFTFGW